MPRGGGLIVDVGDVDALADGIADRLLDPDLADREGAVAEQHVAAHHDVNSSARDVARADPASVPPRPRHRRRADGPGADGAHLAPAPEVDGDVLVTGGAGYIGAHVVRLLGAAATTWSSSTTWRRGILSAYPACGSNGSTWPDPAIGPVAALLADEGIDAVLHFAARKQVLESVQRPAWYYQQNVGGLANLLLAMEAARVERLVFSSSAAVYGGVTGGAIPEDVRALPVNPYGETKLVGEQLVSDATAAFGLSAVSLRYFNVAGAGWPELADRAVLNLVPMVIERIDNGEPPLDLRRRLRHGRRHLCSRLRARARPGRGAPGRRGPHARRSARAHRVQRRHRSRLVGLAR